MSLISLWSTYPSLSSSLPTSLKAEESEPSLCESIVHLDCEVFMLIK